MKSWEKWFRPPYCILILFVVIFIIYGQSLAFTLGKLDEYNIILINLDLLRDASNLKKVFFSNPFFNQGGDFYRPLQNLSFMADAHLSGAEGWGYYLTNIILHGITCSLLYYLLTLIGKERKIAFLLALLFAVHPLFVQTVAWAPSRGDMLMTAFGLLSFVAWLRFLKSGNYLFLALHALAFGCALFSKEPAIFIPAVCYLWYFLFEREKKIKPAILILPLLVYAILIALFFYIRNVVVQISVPHGQIGLLTLLEHLRTIPELLFKFFIPAGLAPMPGFGLLLTIGGALIIALIIFVSVRVKPLTIKVFLFGSFWFILFIGPTLFFVNEYGSTAFDYMEHRAYFPSVGIVIFIFSWIEQHGNIRRYRQIPAYLSLLVLVFGIYSYVHAGRYKDPVTYFDMAVKANPSSAVAIYCRGTVLFYEKKDYRSAISDFDEALKLYPSYGQAYLNRGFCREQLNDNSGAENDYRTAAHVNPLTYEPHAALAFLFTSTGKKQEALPEYDSAITLNPKFLEGYYQRALLRTESGDYSGALADLDRAIILNDRFADAFANRGILKFQMQEYQAALDDLNRAVQLDDQSAETYLNRGRVYYWLKMDQNAYSDWQKAAQLGSQEAKTLLSRFNNE
jgi:tetratricopeptide (TPR) repeat protein